MLNGDLNSEFLNGNIEIRKLFNDVGKNERKNLSPEDSKLLADKIGKYAENLLKMKQKLQSNFHIHNLNEEEFIKNAIIELGIE